MHPQARTHTARLGIYTNGQQHVWGRKKYTHPIQTSLDLQTTSQLANQQKQLEYTKELTVYYNQLGEPV